ncbi:uncharacterized protein DUF4333 [Kribbella orskensis]|uniref:Uncharacterized protein DUF4333 n=1 Tax=Kribbella orskensis TaxID=2512216 RepID=A0ABY2BAV8_9ACTN|nr:MULTISPECIES: DUF4333 domain-containing protein [Kribbella]TCN33574.1 uncharacterized protein DUF4333 [Kribbella sp. VKM Ac-2500]TCO14019.1 uncharacterized protein DUF4333 [Kribbella orskensis]
MAPVVLLAAALLVGCSADVTVGGDTVDSDRTADAVGKYLRELVPEVQVGSVTCPKEVKVAEGASFQCTAEVAGSQLPVTVTLSHVKDGDYTYELKPSKALIDSGKVTAEIKSRLPAQAAAATVDCGTPRVRVVEVGRTIPCTISLGSKRQVVRTVVDNLDGTVHFEPATVWPVTPPKSSTGKIGDTLTVYDEAGDAQLEATVTRLKFSVGDEFDRPEHGLYLGAYVKLRALADGQDLVEITALVGGRSYSGDAIITSTAFDPPLDPVILDKGEQASGWLVFDVPARHGQLVMHDVGGHQLAAWKY